MHAHLALQVEGEGGDLLHRAAGDQLADRILRPRSLALGQRGDSAEGGVFQAACPDGPGGELGAHGAILDDRPVGRRETAAEIEQLGKSGRHVGADGEPLVHQRRQRDLPAAANLAQPLAVGDAHVGEIDFVEARLAVDLLDRTDLDTLRFHVEEEHGHPLMLRHRGIGTRDQDAEIGKVRAAGPNLLAVDHPVLTVAFGPRAQAGEIGTR